MVTCIAGLVEGERVYIGADGYGASNDWHGMQLANPKVFTFGRWVVGYTSSFRMGQILEHHVDWTDGPLPDEDARAWIVDQQIGRIRAAFSEHGFQAKHNEREEGGAFLMGLAGSGRPARLFRVEEDYSILERLDGFDAVGCGAPYALGAMAMTSGAPERRVRRALRCAERFSAGVSCPFTVLEA